MKSQFDRKGNNLLNSSNKPHVNSSNGSLVFNGELGFDKEQHAQVICGFEINGNEVECSQISEDGKFSCAITDAPDDSMKYKWRVFVIVDGWVYYDCYNYIHKLIAAL